MINLYYIEYAVKNANRAYNLKFMDIGKALVRNTDIIFNILNERIQNKQMKFGGVPNNYTDKEQVINIDLDADTVLLKETNAKASIKEIWEFVKEIIVEYFDIEFESIIVNDNINTDNISDTINNSINDNINDDNKEEDIDMDMNIQNNNNNKNNKMVIKYSIKQNNKYNHKKHIYIFMRIKEKVRSALIKIINQKAKAKFKAIKDGIEVKLFDNVA